MDKHEHNKKERANTMCSLKISLPLFIFSWLFLAATPLCFLFSSLCLWAPCPANAKLLLSAALACFFPLSASPFLSSLHVCSWLTLDFLRVAIFSLFLIGFLQHLSPFLPSPCISAWYHFRFLEVLSSSLLPWPPYQLSSFPSSSFQSLTVTCSNHSSLFPCSYLAPLLLSYLSTSSYSIPPLTLSIHSSLSNPLLGEKGTFCQGNLAGSQPRHNSPSTPPSVLPCLTVCLPSWCCVIVLFNHLVYFGAFKQPHRTCFNLSLLFILSDGMRFLKSLGKVQKVGRWITGERRGRWRKSKPRTSERHWSWTDKRRGEGSEEKRGLHLNVLISYS